MHIEDEAEKRRETRSGVIIRAVVNRPMFKPVERRVRNLNTTGGCIDHTGDLVEGDELLLNTGTLTALAARVVWASESLAGLAFAEPVDLAAARKPGGVAVTVKAGWLAEMKDMHR